MPSILNFLTAGRFRLLLATIVLLHHTLGFFGFGAAAVYLFFVLSGYWISRLWRTSHTYCSKSLVSYALSRWMRLAPIFGSVLLLALSCTKFSPGILGIEAETALSEPKWWGKALTIVNLANQPLVISPAWSLVVEMQFYLLYPLLSWLILKSRWTFYIIFGTSLAIGIASLIGGTSSTSGNVLIFLPYFLFGIGHDQHLFRFSRKHSDIFATLYIIATTTIALIPPVNSILTNYPGKSEGMIIAQNLWFYLSTFLLAPLACETVHRLRGLGDRFMGNLAYPLYLFHILPVSFYYYYRDIIGLPKLVTLLLCWSVAAAGALALYYLIDRPFETLRKKLFHSSTRSQLP